MKPIYVRNDKGQFKTTHHFNKLGIAFLIALATLLAYGMVMTATTGKLVSPIEGISMAPTVIYAKEEVISCENPKGYLECQVYKGIITWAEHNKLTKIIQCESGWRTDAINKNNNGTFDLGLFQINTVHGKKISRADALDFKKNIDFGIKLFKEQGLRPWVCARKLGISK